MVRRIRFALFILTCIDFQNYNMKKNFQLLFALFFMGVSLNAQKKELDHTVYDNWQRIGEKSASDNGKWIVYSIDKQEGDNELVVMSSDGTYKRTFPRGYSASFSFDNQFLVFKIKPFFAEAKEAKNKKKKLEDQPKDSLACLLLGTDSIWKKQRIKSFKLPEEESGWMAYSYDLGSESADAGSDLFVRNMKTGEEKKVPRVSEYFFSKKGLNLVVEQTKDAKDSLSQAQIILFSLSTNTQQTLSKGGNDFRSFVFSEQGNQLAFLAERTARPKELVKYYHIYYFKNGMDSAKLLVDRHSAGMKLGNTVSENGELSFSKSGSRLFFGIAPIVPAKDTTLVESDLVKLDIWNYKDDYLQTQQLFTLSKDLQKNYQAVYLFNQDQIRVLGSEKIPTVYFTNGGDGDFAIGVSDYGHRIESQWTGNTLKDIYLIGVSTDSVSLIKKELNGNFSSAMISYSGKKIIWYDNKLKQYVCWDGKSSRVISASIKFPLWDEEYDQPSDPTAYGFMGFASDSTAYVYDRFDAWKLDLSGKRKPINITVDGRQSKNSYRYIKLNAKEHYIGEDSVMIFRFQNDLSKDAGLLACRLQNDKCVWFDKQQGAYTYGNPEKALHHSLLIYTRESYVNAPDLYSWNPDNSASSKLSSINAQQANYNWGTASIYKWKTFDGKDASGVLYRPENFDPTKKYPLILYFYETHTNTLNAYIPPTPTGSRLNISFFVSRGYVVFSPDIHYTIGHPAKSCYNYVVSAAASLAKQNWIDGKNMGIQGQSWGGIQVAQLVTMTNIFKAAWAGAPVANMTSAYGGIRWESGVNRQFQYEKTQSRIGATLWEKPELYIENSPLFHLPKVTTPLVIMSNDADGAVPWYQGIELFSAMKRLNKKVWMLNYNGEAHNLKERKNQKDISIREQQYFDWLLKGAKAPRWITEGVPAVKKGRDWGLELAD
jgi:dipeptidyl aminopeptidase/acylaminoacyl peptidase